MKQLGCQDGWTTKLWLISTCMPYHHPLRILNVAGIEPKKILCRTPHYFETAWNADRGKCSCHLHLGARTKKTENLSVLPPLDLHCPCRKTKEGQITSPTAPARIRGSSLLRLPCRGHITLALGVLLDQPSQKKNGQIHYQ